MMNITTYCGKCKFDCPHKELREYVLAIGYITDAEMNDLLEWVEAGNSVYDNPNYYADERGKSLDYISAMRVIEEQLAERESFQRYMGEKQLRDEETEVPF